MPPNAAEGHFGWVANRWQRHEPRRTGDLDERAYGNPMSAND